jgi:multicomponent Na+:H+ antiporter subunit C
MYVVLAVLIGALFAAAIYLILRRSMVKLIVGLSLLTNATNLLILTVGGLTRATPPLVPAGAARPEPPYADPIPQALILTAIVIGFGVLAFMMALAYRTYTVVGSEDLDDLVATDALTPRALAPINAAAPQTTPTGDGNESAGAGRHQAEAVVIEQDQL